MVYTAYFFAVVASTVLFPEKVSVLRFGDTFLMSV